MLLLVNGYRGCYCIVVEREPRSLLKSKCEGGRTEMGFYHFFLVSTYLYSGTKCMLRSVPCMFN